jgi:hypothetical protein
LGTLGCPSFPAPSKYSIEKMAKPMRREFEDDDRDAIAPSVDLEKDLPRSVYEIPDEYWGFRAYNRDSHPGVCTASDGHLATLIQGTDPIAVIAAGRAHVLIDPSPENGLKKQTAFKLEPRRFRARKIGLMHFDRLRGRLSEEDHIRITTELAYLFRDEEELK